MISEFEFFHGVTFAHILHAAQREVRIKSFNALDNAAYVLDGTKGIYIKYSTKRLSPWRFSFQQRHVEQILSMKEALGSAFLVLVCNDDGIVVLSFDEITEILGGTGDAVEWVSATRSRRKMYSIKGSRGELSLKVGRDDFLRKMFDLTQA
jgi:hypothetical protein